MDEIKKIHTKDLKVSDLPVPYTDWYQFCLFALSWDPSVELESGQPPYRAVTIDHTPDDNSTLLDIRCYLYLQQRWWNNKTEDIDDESFGKIHKVIELLRKKLQ